ncbi:hypothetical protein CK203_064177 [Vitis vinifera]|uniref:Ubiquitin-like protease family profile domain-containing protein n=1 Tax=Vitis vinifera TaxID=29760 RepID=A0A438G5H7_VITVI|nr:hypothetical protein CK203_064177 [Vitis vinifera]
MTCSTKEKKAEKDTIVCYSKGACILIIWSERDGLEVVRNPKRPIGAWIKIEISMMKEKDKGVKINDDETKIEKLGGYANENLKIWVIENEIRDCVDGNATTMASENEDDEKFVINLNKYVIKRVDGGNLMEMDKTFQQLKTHLIDMAYGASSSRCDQILAKFEENYTTVKGLFLRSSGKPLRMHEEGTKNDMLSCERSLEDTNNMNEPLRALCGYPNHVMKTRSSRERKPSKFKVSPFVHKLRKMVKREASESIPMSIREDVVDTQSFVLQSLVADYVFNKALSKGKDVFQFSIDWAPLIPTQENGWDYGVHVIRHMQRFKNGDSMTSSDFFSTLVDRLMNDVQPCELVDDLSQPPQPILDAESPGVSVQLSD